MTKLCPVCDEPVPPPRKPKNIPHKKYCSDKCRRINTDQTAHMLRTKGYRLLRFMETNCPIALTKILNQMEQ